MPVFYFKEKAILLPLIKKSMSNFILIFMCVASGMIISRRGFLPHHSFKSINTWILYVALPALSLRYVPGIEWNIGIILPALSPILMWLGAWIFVSLYSAKKNISQATKTALLLTCGLANTAFLGFPMIAAYYGEKEISNAIVFDQITFLMFSTIAVIVVLKASSEKHNRITFPFLAKKVFSFPPFIATICALTFSSFIDFSVMNPLLDKLVATMSPLALFSIGLQIQFSGWKKEIKHLCAALSYKLLLAPAIIMVFAILMKANGNLARISVFEAAMPSHITASLLASQYNLDPKLCNLMVGIGIIVSFITTALWWFALQFVF